MALTSNTPDAPGPRPRRSSRRFWVVALLLLLLAVPAAGLGVVYFAPTVFLGPSKDADSTGEIRVGMRPPEVAHPGTSVLRDMLREHGVPKDAPPIMLETLAEASKIRVEPEAYADALRNWDAHALAPDEVIARSRPRDAKLAEAAARFELAQHLYRAGHAEDAREHFRAAHRLDPANWTYRRQAWSFEDPLQGPTEHYDGDWLNDVRAAGPDSYYALPDL